MHTPTRTERLRAALHHPYTPLLAAQTLLGILLASIPIVRTASYKGIFIATLVNALVWPIVWLVQRKRLTQHDPPHPNPSLRTRAALFTSCALIPFACIVLASLLFTRACELLQGLSTILVSTLPGIALAFGLCEVIEATTTRLRPLLWTLFWLLCAAFGVYWFLNEPVYQVTHPLAGMLLGPPNESHDILIPRTAFLALETLSWSTLCLGLSVLLHKGIRHAHWTAFTASALGAISAVALLANDAELEYRMDETHIQRAFRPIVERNGLRHVFSSYIPSDALPWIELEAQFQRQRQIDLLKIPDKDFPTATLYWYRNRDDKKYWTGAHRTKFAKVHRRELYISTDSFPPRTVGHELAHITSGLYSDTPLQVPGALGGLWYNPALVEGFAVAVDWSDSPMSAHERARVALDADRIPPIEDLFSPLGFINTNLSVAYRASGSFVRYCIDTYGPKPVTDWFGSNDFEASFNIPLERAERDWKTHLNNLPIRKRDTSRVNRRQTRPSIGQESCSGPTWYSNLRRAIDNEADDTLQRLLKRPIGSEISRSKRRRVQATRWMSHQEYRAKRSNYTCDIPDGPAPGIRLQDSQRHNLQYLQALTAWGRGDRDRAASIFQNMPEHERNTDLIIFARILLRDGYNVQDLQPPKGINSITHTTLLWQKDKHPVFGYRLAMHLLRNQSWSQLHTLMANLNAEDFNFPEDRTGNYPTTLLAMRARSAFAMRDWDTAAQAWRGYIKRSTTQGRINYGTQWLQRTQYFKQHAQTLTTPLPHL